MSSKFILQEKITNNKVPPFGTVDYAYWAGLCHRAIYGRRVKWADACLMLRQLEQDVEDHPCAFTVARLVAYKCARLGKSLKSCGGSIAKDE